MSRPAQESSHQNSDRIAVFKPLRGATCSNWRNNTELGITVIGLIAPFDFGPEVRIGDYISVGRIPPDTPHHQPTTKP